MIAINTSGNRVACLVLMLPDEAIKAQGVDPQETYRREIALAAAGPRIMAERNGNARRCSNDSASRFSPRDVGQGRLGMNARLLMAGLPARPAK
jgi:hypothetical protein